MEWNFQHILEEKLISLLHQQKIYWKQRGTIRWVTTGDAGTKFFHAHATIKHSDHSTKASLLWESFKERLGQSDFQDMQLDLDTLLQASTELGCLEEPFTTKEIDAVINHCLFVGGTNGVGMPSTTGSIHIPVNPVVMAPSQPT